MEQQIRNPGVEELILPKEESYTYKDFERSNVETLSNCAESVAYFTPAIFRLFLRLNRDPIQQFYDEQNKDIDLRLLAFDKPVFDGLVSDVGETGWNHVLYTCPRDTWPALFSYLGSLAICDRGAGLLARIHPRRVKIVDPAVDADKISTNWPCVTVTVFCLNTNKGCVYIRGEDDGDTAGDWRTMDEALGNYQFDICTTTRTTPPIRPYVVRTKRTFPETVTMAEAWLSTKSNIYKTNPGWQNVEERDYLQNKFGDPNAS